MTTGEWLRSKTDEELAAELWWMQINIICEVMQNGFVNTMNAADMKTWIASEHDEKDRWFIRPEGAVI